MDSSLPCHTGPRAPGPPGLLAPPGPELTPWLACPPAPGSNCPPWTGAGPWRPPAAGRGGGGLSPGASSGVPATVTLPELMRPDGGQQGTGPGVVQDPVALVEEHRPLAV